MMNEFLQHSPAAEQWKIIGDKTHHGINLPLFALRSQASCGIGEFYDLIPLIKWCKDIDFDVIQLLPLNDNGNDASPYSALSAYALNPLHLSLTKLPGLESSQLLQNLIHELQSLNNTQRISYKSVQAGKEKFFKEYFRLFFDSLSKTENYDIFLEQNSWLYSYALFKTLKIQRNWESWERWKDIDDLSVNFEKLLNQHQEDIAFHIFTQYLCFQQLEDVRNQAKQSGVLIKGDIPILINRESADVWAFPQLFQLEYSAGAPPDMYSKDGQKWGFPIYNWKSMEQYQYFWWIQRLKVAERLYDLYRLDHIVGFFRIWAIPPALSSKQGKFIPEDKSQWIPQGEKIMRMMLGNSSMLPIGEDLGEVPPEVRKCMRSLGICGTKVMRWERNWETDKSFIDIRDYPIESMTTVSTHDSETLVLWWRDHPEEAKAYANTKGWTYQSHITQEQLFSILYDSHHSASLFHINLLQEYFSLIPDMTWPNPADERINIPGIVSEKNWTYRFRPTVEEIVTNATLKTAMKRILSQ